MFNTTQIARSVAAVALAFLTSAMFVDSASAGHHHGGGLLRARLLRTGLLPLSATHSRRLENHLLVRRLHLHDFSSHPVHSRDVL